MKKININSEIKHKGETSLFKTNLFCYNEKESKFFKDEMYKIIDNNETYYIKKEDIKTSENDYEIKRMLSRYKEKELTVKKEILFNDGFQNELEKSMSLRKVEKIDAYKEYKNNFFKKCRNFFVFLCFINALFNFVIPNPEHAKTLITVYFMMMMAMLFIISIYEYFSMLLGNKEKEVDRIGGLFYQLLLKNSEIKDIEVDEKEELLITNIKMKDNVNELKAEDVLFKIQEKISKKHNLINNV